MKKYMLEKHGGLLYTSVAVGGKNTVIVSKFLVDTGSSFTILPWETLVKIGRDPSVVKERTKVITASGYVWAPKLQVEWIHSLGVMFENFSVTAHSLPEGMYADGILGMDFLTKAKVTINIFEGSIKTEP